MPLGLSCFLGFGLVEFRRGAGDFFAMVGMAYPIGHPLAVLAKRGTSGYAIPT